MSIPNKVLLNFAVSYRSKHGNWSLVSLFFCGELNLLLFEFMYIQNKAYQVTLPKLGSTGGINVISASDSLGMSRRKWPKLKFWNKGLKQPTTCLTLSWHRDKFAVNVVTSTNIVISSCWKFDLFTFVNKGNGIDS